VNRKRHGARCTHRCMRRGIGRRTATRRKAHRSKCTLSLPHFFYFNSSKTLRPEVRRISCSLYPKPFNIENMV
jgi:hypothetical protein